ncbi:MAG TPA: glycosyltransferase [Allosphingosinicella sp.]|nr:glycosyltransferase [Allosphingosinicella sp.]
MASEDDAPAASWAEAVESEPLVSVILVVRDRAWCVGRAIESVLAQSYRRFELIVVDDGSTDGTREAVKGFGDRLRFFPRGPEGPYEARNFALKQAFGELIAFIDSDDSWRPGKLAAQVPLMRRPEVGLVFGDTAHLTEPRDGAPLTGRTSFAVSPPSRGRAAHRLAWSNFVPTCTVLVRRSCLEEIGGFSVSSPISADYPAWFRIALDHEIDHVDEIVADYTVHPRGISFDLGRSLAARIGLFAAELDRAPDDRAKALIRRLLFNLSLHLGLAVVRGRAGSVHRPARLAWRTATGAAGPRAFAWTGAFALRQLKLRTGLLAS